MAPRLGFEPRYTAPEAVVLPLDDLGICAKLWPDSIEMHSLGQAIFHPDFYALCFL